ncbi:MAG: efflux RND transporter periplasmic adaptor subunit [Candidatus Eisenbacteria bacterium]|nr:efflux RND transporter periplasmic adaptor subunit [Candidatus Eisenbacteria bacterium]
MTRRCVSPPSRGRVGYVVRGLACSLIAALVLSGCTNKKAAHVPPVPVTVAKVVIQPTPLSLDAVGVVEALETVSVKAQVGGVVTQVRFSEGQEVRAGQPLFEIDPRPFKVALDAAEAQLARDKSQSANAEVQAKRYADLIKKDFVTQEQYDDAVTQAEMLRSTVQADDAAVEQSRLNLAYASILAPISGRTGSILVKRGNVVKANDATLVVINQMTPVRVSFAVPESRLPLVKKYADRGRLEVRVKPSRDGSRPEVKGHLAFLDNAVDPNTGTVTLKAELSNEDDSLLPGQFVDTELILTVETDALTVPAGAVVTGQDGSFVFVVGSDNKVEKRPVEVNRTFNNTAVVERGLKPGETVVTDGQMRLVPGATVAVRLEQKTGSR